MNKSEILNCDHTWDLSGNNFICTKCGVTKVYRNPKCPCESEGTRCVSCENYRGLKLKRNGYALEAGASRNIRKYEGGAIDLEKMAIRDCANGIADELGKLSEQGCSAISFEKEMTPMNNEIYTMRINIIANKDLANLLHFAEIGKETENYRIMTEVTKELSWPKEIDLEHELARQKLLEIGKRASLIIADIKLDLIAAITHQKEMRFGLMPKDSIWYQGNESGLTIALGIIEGYEVKQ